MPQLPKLPAHRRSLPPEMYSFMVETRDCLRSLFPVISLDVLTSHTSRGVSRKGLSRVQAGESSNIKIYSITAVQNDYLTCQEIKADGSLSATQVNIARPLYLRASGGAYTYPDKNTRRILQGSVNIDELVTPPYAIGDEIVAADLVRTSIAQVDGAAVTLEDVNADGRQWRFPKISVEVCVSGVTKHIFIYGSAVY